MYVSVNYRAHGSTLEEDSKQHERITKFYEWKKFNEFFVNQVQSRPYKNNTKLSIRGIKELQTNVC